MLCAVLALFAACAWALVTGAVRIPDRFNPWAPLDVAASPDWLTGFKLSRARAEPGRCRAALAHTGMAYDPLPDRETGQGCGFDNAVRLRAAGVRLEPAPSLSCPMALSFFMWEHHALQPAAARHFGQPVVAVEHLGSYACRNVNRGEGNAPGAGSANRSRHATANALDVAGFTLRDGRRITVRQAWLPGDAGGARNRQGGQGSKGGQVDQATQGPMGPQDVAALFLRDAHQGACRYFDGVLGPDYNAVHHDHFHLETGGYAMCR